MDAGLVAKWGGPQGGEWGLKMAHEKVDLRDAEWVLLALVWVQAKDF